MDRQQLSIDSSSRRCTSHVVTVTKQMQALDFSHQGMASLGGLLTLGDLIILRATSHPTCSFACQVQIELSAAHIHSVIGLNFLPGDMDASPEGDYNFIKTFVQRDNIDIRQAVRHCGYTWDPKESAFRRRFCERHIEDYHKDFPPKDYRNYRYHSEWRETTAQVPFELEVKAVASPQHCVVEVWGEPALGTNFNEMHIIPVRARLAFLVSQGGSV